MDIKRTSLLLFLSLLFLNFAIGQHKGIVFNIGLNQSLYDEIHPGFEMNISGRVNAKFLDFEYGISVVDHVEFSSSTHEYTPLLQIDEGNVKTEDYRLTSRLRYAALPIGIVLTTKKKIDFGIGLQPMVLLNGKRTRKLDYYNTDGDRIRKDYTETNGEYPDFNLEFYAYLKVPVWKKFALMLKVNDGLTTLRPDFPGSRPQVTIKTKRVTFGLSYSI